MTIFSSQLSPCFIRGAPISMWLLLVLQTSWSKLVRSGLKKKKETKGGSCHHIAVEHFSHTSIAVSDRIRLKQVVLNLGRNSAKFVEKGFIRLGADVVDGKVQLSIEDSGPGIPEEKRSRLFAKFQESTLNVDHVWKNVDESCVLVLISVLYRWRSHSLHHRLRLFVARNRHWA